MVICLTQDLIDIIVEVPIDGIVLQFLIVCIGIRAVATAVDITIHPTMDTNRIAAIDGTGDIISTIDIIYVTSSNQQTGCVTGREMTFNAIECTIQFWHIIFIRVHIGHTTTTIDVVDVHTITVDNQQDTLFVCHRASISATVEITDCTVL